MRYTNVNFLKLITDLPKSSFKCTFRRHSKDYEGLLVKNSKGLYLKSDVLEGAGEPMKPYKYSWILDDGRYSHYGEGGIASITVNVTFLGEL